MKTKSIILLIVVVVVGSVVLWHLPKLNRGRMPEVEWETQPGGDWQGGIAGMALDPHGNVFLVSWVDTDFTYPRQAKATLLFCKYNARGRKIWEKRIIADTVWGQTVIWNCCADRNGNLYLVGCTDGNFFGRNKGERDVFFAKISGDGKLLWGRQIGSKYDDIGEAVTADEHGNVYVVGTTQGLMFGYRWYKDIDDGFIIKYDSSGKQLWGKQFGNAHDDSFSAVCIGKQGAIYIAGQTLTLFKPNSNNADGLLMKLDPQGKLIWGKQIGEGGYDSAASIATDRNENIYIGGSLDIGEDQRELHAVSQKGFVAKYKKNGTRLWQDVLTASREDGVRELTIDRYGNVTAIGYTSGNLFARNAGSSFLSSVFWSLPSTTALLGLPQWSEDIFIVQYSAVGKRLWTSQFGDSRSDWLTGVATGVDGSLYISGVKNGNPLRSSENKGDTFLAKLKPAIDGD